jgi:predicted nucleotidyltransferase
MGIIQGYLLAMLSVVARALDDDLRHRLVFVGGCTTALLITDPVTLEDVRATDDVDLIVDLAGYAGWAQLQQQLQGRGFSLSSEDTVICRMRLGKLKVDFMPDDPQILGFTNRWYARGIATAVAYRLDDDLVIRHLTAPLFLATKLEAYFGRGNDDLFSSRDAEDILLIVDGREALIAEVEAADDDVRAYIGNAFKTLLALRDFDDFLEGNIRGPRGRVGLVRDRFVAIIRNADGG